MGSARKRKNKKVRQNQNQNQGQNGQNGRQTQKGLQIGGYSIEDLWDHKMWVGAAVIVTVVILFGIYSGPDRSCVACPLGQPECSPTCTTCRVTPQTCNTCAVATCEEEDEDEDDYNEYEGYDEEDLIQWCKEWQPCCSSREPWTGRGCNLKKTQNDCEAADDCGWYGS